MTVGFHRHLLGKKNLEMFATLLSLKYTLLGG